MRASRASYLAAVLTCVVAHVWTTPAAAQWVHYPIVRLHTFTMYKEIVQVPGQRVMLNEHNASFHGRSWP